METKDLVLVTDGTGFLAGHCIIELLRNSHQVRTMVRDLAGRGERRATITRATGEAANLDIVEADLGRDRGWKEAINSSHYVSHTASPLSAAQPRNADKAADLAALIRSDVSLPSGSPVRCGVRVGA